MSHYYSITVRATFGVLADDQAEAEQLARQACPTEDFPVRASVSIDAYLTPNQSADLKRDAINN